MWQCVAIAQYCVAIVKSGVAIGKQPEVQFQGQLSTCHFDPDLGSFGVATYLVWRLCGDC